MLSRYIFAVALCIASSASAGPIVIDGNGKFVGYYLGVTNGSWTDEAVTEEGYRFAFHRRSGRVEFTTNAFVGYATTDCTGPLRASPVAPGFVSPVYEGGLLAYVPQDAQEEPVHILSMRVSDDTCGSPPYPISVSVPALPNDPDVTGVESPQLTIPIRISSSPLFRDSFEQPLSVRFVRVEWWASAV